LGRGDGRGEGEGRGGAKGEGRVMEGKGQGALKWAAWIRIRLCGNVDDSVRLV